MILLTTYLNARNAKNNEQKKKIPFDQLIPFLNKYIKSLHAFFKDQAAVESVFENPSDWNQLNSSEKGMVAGMYFPLMEKMLASGELAQLSTQDLSMCVSAYSLNINTLRGACGLFESYGDFSAFPQQATTEEREALCFKIAKNHPELIDKLNPTAQLLFLGFLKQSQIIKNKSNELPPAMLAKITDAFAEGIRFNYAQSEGTWNCYLLPSLAGGFGIGDYVGREDEIYQQAMGYNHTPTPTTNASEIEKLHASIYILDNRYVTDSVFFEDNRKNNKYLNSMAAKKLNVAKRHPHIALLLIEKPELRDNVFRGSDMTMESLARHHGKDILNTYLSVTLQQRDAEIQKLKAELDKMQAQQMALASASALARSRADLFQAGTENRSALSMSPSN